jgi:PhnB protein
MAAKKKKKASKKVAKKKVQAVPTNYSTICPGFGTKQPGDKVIDFYKNVFGAKVQTKMTGPDGAVVHCELRMGNSVLMFGAPMDGNEYTMHAMTYVKDCDATVQKALAHGASVKQAVEDQFYGDRAGRVVDPFGNDWFIATHVEDVPKKEMDRRMAAMMQGQPWK